MDGGEGEGRFIEIMFGVNDGHEAEVKVKQSQMKRAAASMMGNRK